MVLVSTTRLIGRSGSPASFLFFFNHYISVGKENGDGLVKYLLLGVVEVVSTLTGREV